MMARTDKVQSNCQHPRMGVWHDIGRDWRRWSRAERIAAPLVMVTMIAATVPVLWLIAQ